MPRNRDWHEEEFLLLLYSPDLTDEEIVRRINRHTLEEVQAVRQGIHRFHLGADAPSLTPGMLHRLAHKDLQTICPLCKIEF